VLRPFERFARPASVQNKKSCGKLISLTVVLGRISLISGLLGLGIAAMPSLRNNIEARFAAQKGGKNMALQVTSNAFSEGQSIPEKYTCDGQNVSPPIRWSGTPENTKSIALICEDPDAPSGTFTHWVLYDLPGKTTELREGSSASGKQGVNGFGKNGYGGPCPPPGGPHRYFFRVYALDTESLGNAGSSKENLAAAMKGHILAEGSLMGTYKRKK
jgi:Raf kinase inhibitor-like YbhB/YbcL family protein